VSIGHGGQAAQAAVEPGRVQRAMDPIVEQISRRRARRRFRFRLTVILTWTVLIGLLVGGLWAAGKIDLAFLSEWQAFILGGIPLTLVISATSIFFACILAILGALGRLSSNALIYGVASFYVSLVRGTPLIVQILFIYLALPQIWPGFSLVPAIVLGIFALAFNYGAYMTEIFRAGIQAIPRGQIEAAHSIGMTDRLTMRRVVLPQAIRIVTPAIGNEFIAMIKDSALVSIITVQELLWRARTVGSSNFRMLETLLLAALVYWVLTLAFSLFQDRLEQRMAESDRRI
jgi:polar amino acid transport system permease protein